MSPRTESLQEEPAIPLPELDQAAPRKRHWWLYVVGAVVLYLLVAAATLIQPIGVPFTGITLAAPLPGVSTAALFGLPNRPFTVLVVGLDRRPDESGPSRTDSILLLRFDPSGKRLGVLSIPRDSMMSVDQGGTATNDRINTAYVYGWDPGDASAAPKAVERTIQQNLGIKVDRYIVFDVFGAEKVIDAFGGVDVDVKTAFGQSDYSDDDVHVVPQWFPQGKQHLDGYQAVAFGRIREGSSDLDRIKRQQQVASALMSKLSSPRALLHAWTLWRAYSDGVHTDMSLRQSMGLAALVRRLPDDGMVLRSLGDAATSCSTCDASLLLLEPGKTAQLVGEAFDDPRIGDVAGQRLQAEGVGAQ